MVFIRIGPFRKDDAHYSTHPIRRLILPTKDTARIVAAALEVLKAIYRHYFKHAEAGVMLMDLQPASIEHLPFDFGDDPLAEHPELMFAIAHLNDRFRRAKVKLGLRHRGRIKETG